MVLELVPPDRPAVIAADGLLLREWRDDDVDHMVSLFDTEEMDRRTPLASPFDREAARSYLRNAHSSRAETGALQLAITEAGEEPLGEVLVFPTTSRHAVELAYAVGAEHRGRGLVRRSVEAVLKVAAAAGLNTARLVVSTENEPSQRVALATGFALTGLPPVERRRKNYVLQMETWERDLRQDAK